jgi:hypothetical protein
VQATDRVGLDAEGAFWLKDPETNRWRLHIATSLLELAGPWSIYARLNRVLPKLLQTDGRTKFEFYLSSPTDWRTERLRKSLGVGEWEGGREIRVESAQMEALVYRLREGRQRSALPQGHRKFRRKFRELVEAA